MYDFNDVSIKSPRSLYKWFEVSAVYLFFRKRRRGGSYMLLLGAIIMMGCVVRRRGSAERQFKKKNVITYRLDELISGFAWQLPRPIREWRRVKESFWWQTKGVYHLQKVGFTTPRRGEGASDTSTKHGGLPVWAPDIHKDLRHVFRLFKLKEQRPLPAKWQLFPPTAASECLWLNANTVRVCVWMYMCVDMCKHAHVCE